MSKERELLKEWVRRYIAREGLNDSYRESISLDDVYGETLSLLTQPEQPPVTQREAYQHGYAQAEIELNRQPLSEDEIVYPNGAWRQSFRKGVSFAENHHKIGVADEK